METEREECRLSKSKTQGENGMSAEKSVLTHREIRYHDDPHHFSNWCAICRLYYCWHPECKDFRNDGIAEHKFIPTTEEMLK